MGALMDKVVWVTGSSRGIGAAILNAGGSLAPPGNIEDASEDVWNGTLALNLTSAFLALKVVLPKMKARRAGNVITVSSAAARRLSAQSPIPYAAAKAGLQVLTQDVASQVGAFGIRVNCIAPETILTERNEARIPAQQKTALVEMHPIKRLSVPDDVASAAWISGVVLDVAGGSVLA